MYIDTYVYQKKTSYGPYIYPNEEVQGKHEQSIRMNSQLDIPRLLEMFHGYDAPKHHTMTID